MVPPAHAHWYAAAVSGAELREVEEEGHVSLVGNHAADILQHLLQAQPAASAPAPESSSSPVAPEVAA